MVQLHNLIQPIWEVAVDPVSVTTFDRDPLERKFVYVNPAFTKLTGYSSAEVVDQPTTILDGPKTSRTAIQNCETVIAQRKACRMTLVHYRKDGSDYTALVTVAPLVEPDGSAQFLIEVETMILPPGPEKAPNMANDISTVIPLALPMPLKEVRSGHLPSHLMSHPELDRLQELWNELRGERPLPKREEFDLMKVSRWASHLSIATVMPTGRFQFCLFGTELTRFYGQDLTGNFLDELTPRDLWSVIILHYQEVVRTLQPLFAPISIANGRWYSEVSRLLLPLAADGHGDRAAFILGADYMRSI